jgi:hypothetical protein
VAHGSTKVAGESVRVADGEREGSCQRHRRIMVLAVSEVKSEPVIIYQIMVLDVTLSVQKALTRSELPVGLWNPDQGSGSVRIGPPDDARTLVGI